MVDLFEVYMKNLKKYEDVGREEAKGSYDDLFIKDYDPITLDVIPVVNEVYFDEDEIHLDISITKKLDEIASLSFDIDIPLSVLVEAVINKILENEDLKKKLLKALREEIE